MTGLQGHYVCHGQHNIALIKILLAITTHFEQIPAKSSFQLLLISYTQNHIINGLPLGVHTPRHSLNGMPLSVRSD